MQRAAYCMVRSAVDHRHALLAAAASTSAGTSWCNSPLGAAISTEIWGCCHFTELQAAFQQAYGKQPPPSALTAELFWRQVNCSQHRTPAAGIQCSCSMSSAWPLSAEMICVPLQAKGPTVARHTAASLFKNEDYFMQIDSHSKLVEGWDDRVIEMYKRWGTRCLSSSRCAVDGARFMCFGLVPTGLEHAGVAHLNLTYFKRSWRCFLIQCLGVFHLLLCQRCLRRHHRGPLQHRGGVCHAPGSAHAVVCLQCALPLGWTACSWACSWGAGARPKSVR